MTIWYSTCRSSGSAAAPPHTSCTSLRRFNWSEKGSVPLARGSRAPRPTVNSWSGARPRARRRAAKESARASERRWLSANGPVRIGRRSVWPATSTRQSARCAPSCQTHLQLPVLEGQERGGAVGCEACERRGSFNQSRAGLRELRPDGARREAPGDRQEHL